MRFNIVNRRRNKSYFVKINEFILHVLIVLCENMRVKEYILPAYFYIAVNLSLLDYDVLWLLEIVANDKIGEGNSFNFKHRKE